MWNSLYLKTRLKREQQELVLQLLAKLSEDTPLEEIARKIELLAGIKTARNQARCSQGLLADETRKLIDLWLTESERRDQLG